MFPFPASARNCTVHFHFSLSSSYFSFSSSLVSATCLNTTVRATRLTHHPSFPSPASHSPPYTVAPLPVLLCTVTPPPYGPISSQSPHCFFSFSLLGVPPPCPSVSLTTWPPPPCPTPRPFSLMAWAPSALSLFPFSVKLCCYFALFARALVEQFISMHARVSRRS